MQVFKAPGGARLGMTYIEVLIYLFVISIAILIFMLFAASLLFDRTRATSVIESQEHARIALARMEAEIMDANGINAASSTFGVNLALPEYGGSVVSLSMASSTLNPTEFSVQDNILYIRQGSATATPFTPDGARIRELYFRNNSSGRARNIGLLLTVEYAHNAINQIFTASTTLRSSVELRGR